MYAMGQNDNTVVARNRMGDSAKREESITPEPDNPEDLSDPFTTIVFPTTDAAWTKSASDNEDSGPVSKPAEKSKKRDWLKRHLKTEVVPVRMRMSEYRRYFAKDEAGRYLDGVVEPPGGRAKWLRERVEEQNVAEAASGRKW